MKTTKYFLAAFLASVLIALPAYAQTNSTRFDIPFNFQVGKDKLPAGEYLFSTRGSTLVIRQIEGSNAVMTATNGMDDPLAVGRAQLVFHRYGDRYFLAQAWAPDRSSGRELFVSSVELEHARNMKQETTVIVAGK
jgi:hypothetical protein